MATTKFGLLVRSFSTSSIACSKLIYPPIHLFGVEGRYAHALFSAASKEKKLDVVEKELKQFQELLKTDTRLAEFVYNPTIKRLVKRDALAVAFKKLNFSSITTNLFSALAENGRLNKLSSLFNAYGKIMGAHRGEVICSVTTAKPLEQGHLKELRAALEAFLQKGETTIILETKVDPSIIGGMIVNIGDRFVDMSMSKRIQTYTNVIKQAV